MEPQPRVKPVMQPRLEIELPPLFAEISQPIDCGMRLGGNSVLERLKSGAGP